MPALDPNPGREIIFTKLCKSSALLVLAVCELKSGKQITAFRRLRPLTVALHPQLSLIPTCFHGTGEAGSLHFLPTRHARGSELTILRFTGPSRVCKGFGICARRNFAQTRQVAGRKEEARSSDAPNTSTEWFMSSTLKCSQWQPFGRPSGKQQQLCVKSA